MVPLATECARIARRLSAALCTLAALEVLPAHAAVYKCEGDDGAPVYQQSRCPRGKELRDFDRDPPTVSVLPLGPAAAPSPGAPAAKGTPPPKTRNTAKARKSTGGSPVERKFLAPGIHEGDVIARVGPPDVRSAGGRKTARWTYLPAPEDPNTVTTLTFEQGRLIEVERKIVR